MKSPSIEQKSLRASPSSFVSSVGWELSEFPWNSVVDSSLPTGLYCLGVDSQTSWSLPNNVAVPFMIENVHFSPLCGVNTSFAWILRGGTPDASTFSSTSMSATLISPFPLSLNWSMPYQGGCSQFLISSKGFDSSICDWKNKFSLFGKYLLFRIDSFRVDFRCVHRFQLLKVCDQYVTLPNSPRNQCISDEYSWISPRTTNIRLEVFLPIE